jgi:hypothetical protein
MLCLIDHENAGYDDLLRKLRRKLKGDDGIRCRKTVVYGMPLLHLTLPVYTKIKEPGAGKISGAAVIRLRKARVSRAIFAKDFPYREAFLREGFEEADGTILTELLAGQLASLACPEGKTVVLIADSLTGSAACTLLELCVRFRHVLTVLESDGSALLKTISRKYGVSVISAPSPAQLFDADVAVSFTPPLRQIQLSGACIAIPVGSMALENIDCRRYVADCTVGLKEQREAELPELAGRFPVNALIAAALDAGVLRTEDLIIRTFRIMEKPTITRY